MLSSGHSVDLEIAFGQLAVASVRPLFGTPYGATPFVKRIGSGPIVTEPLIEFVLPSKS